MLGHVEDSKPFAACLGVPRMSRRRALSCRSSRRLALLQPELQESNLERAASCGDLSSHSLHGKLKCMTAHKLSSLNTMFGLPPDSVYQDDYSCALLRRGVLLQGRLYVYDTHVAFYSSLLFGSFVTKLVIPLRSITCVSKHSNLGFPNSIKIWRGAFVDTFTSFLSRGAAFELVNRMVAVQQQTRSIAEAGTSSDQPMQGSATTTTSSASAQPKRPRRPRPAPLELPASAPCLRAGGTVGSAREPSASRVAQSCFACVSPPGVRSASVEQKAVAVAQGPASPMTTQRPLTHFSSAPPDCPTAEALPAAAGSPPHSSSAKINGTSIAIKTTTTATSTPVCPTPQQPPSDRPQSSASSPESPFKTTSSDAPEAEPALSCTGQHSAVSDVGADQTDLPKVPQRGCGLLRWGIMAAAALSLLLLVLSLARTPFLASAGARATIAAHGAGAAYWRPAHSGSTRIIGNAAAPLLRRAAPEHLTYGNHGTVKQREGQPAPGEVLGEAELLRAHAQVILHEFALVSRGLAAVSHELGAVAGQMTAEGAAAAAAAGCGGTGGAGARGAGSERQACKGRAAGGNR